MNGGQSTSATQKRSLAETKQVLELFAKWLYQNKNFLCELISNASDNDKLEMLAPKDEDLFAGDSDPKIWVILIKQPKH